MGLEVPLTENGVLLVTNEVSIRRKCVAILIYLYNYFWI
jgi:hypothetical protein